MQSRDTLDDLIDRAGRLPVEGLSKVLLEVGWSKEVFPLTAELRDRVSAALCRQLRIADLVTQILDRNRT